MTKTPDQIKRNEVLQELARLAYAQIVKQGGTAEDAYEVVEGVRECLAIEIAHIHKQAQA